MNRTTTHHLLSVSGTRSENNQVVTQEFRLCLGTQRKSTALLRSGIVPLEILRSSIVLNPVVFFIIPTRNGEENIGRAAAKVSEVLQNLAHEIIVMDGLSSACCG